MVHVTDNQAAAGSIICIIYLTSMQKDNAILTKLLLFLNCFYNNYKRIFFKR